MMKSSRSLPSARPLRSTRRASLILACSLIACGTAAVLAQGVLSAPEQAFGFRLGSDQKLVKWDDVTSYLDELAKGTDKLRIIDIGKSTLGRRLIAAVISSQQNLADLERYRAIVRQLADPRATPPDLAAKLAADGRVIVAIGCSIHASELGAAQMAPELVHRLISDTSVRTQRILDNVIFLLFPSMNPDGMDLVVDWYGQTLGKPWEGGSMPWLYNQYVGHDINRDFFMLTQVENRVFAKVFYEDWRPQVFLTMHQMGERGPRLFVPPNVDPIDPNYEPLIWREAGLLGHAIATDLESRGLKGVLTNAMYDYFFPGYEDSGPIGHNTVCMLTEAASVRLASPTTVKREELTGSAKGLPEYRMQQNFPDPWEGGSWHLRDIVDYDLYAALALLDAAAKYREELLHNYYQMGRNQIEKAKTQPPFAFVVPASQRDPLTAVKMINILRNGAVEVWRAREGFEADGRRYGAGSYVVLMEQPYRAYAKTLLERQDYPARRTVPGRPIERPYDVAGWTLPLQMGVETVTVERPFYFDREAVAKATPPPVTADTRGAALVLPPEINDTFIAVNRIVKDGGAVMRVVAPVKAGTADIPAGAFLTPLTAKSARALEHVRALGIPTTTIEALPAGSTAPVKAPRIALYKPWTANIDEGWTRWLLEQFEFAFTSLPDADVRAGALGSRFDVIVLPSIRTAQSLVEGNRQGSTAPEYTGGIGAGGVANIKEFVEQGGTLVALAGSTAFAIDRLGLPVRNVLAGVKPDTFSCPGSIIRTGVDARQPVGFGMPVQSVAVFQNNAAFDIMPSFGDAQPKVVVKYANDGLLLSGWLEGEAQLANRAAVVDAPLGKGHVILFGFGVQQRAQSHATFKLLFNALYYLAVK
jgi:hypothetical protein